MARHHITERTVPHPPPDEPKWLDRRWRYWRPPPIVRETRTMLLQHVLRVHGPDCCWCGTETIWPAPGERSGSLPHHRTLEHLIPRGMGGTDTIDNVRIACYACNTSRGVMQEWDIWLHRLKYLAPNKLYGSYVIGDEAI